MAEQHPSCSVESFTRGVERRLASALVVCRSLAHNSAAVVQHPLNTKAQESEHGLLASEKSTMISAAYNVFFHRKQMKYKSLSSARFRRLSRNNVQEHVSSVRINCDTKNLNREVGGGLAVRRREAPDLSVSSQNKRLSVNRNYFLNRPKQ